MRSTEYNIICDGKNCPDYITGRPAIEFHEALSDAVSKATKAGWTLNWGDMLNGFHDFCPDCKPGGNK